MGIKGSTVTSLPLRGIAVVHQEDDSVAIWCLGMNGPSSVDAVNAVVVPVEDIPRIEAALHRQMVIAVDPEDLPDGLSGDRPRLVQDVIDVLDSATGDLQRDILDAIAAHEKAKRTTLVRPEWVRRQPTETVALAMDSAHPTLAHANLVKARWQEWLDTEKQRVRRSRSPRTGETPYIMPAELSMPAVRPLPAALGAGDMAVPTQQGTDVAVEE